MSTFTDAIAKHKDLPLEAQKKAGKPIAGDIDEEHTNFLKKIIGMLDSGEIDPYRPESFLKKDVYDVMPLEWKGKTDQAMVNIATQLQQIHTYYHDKGTPNDAPQLATMIEHLWQMKQRIEEKYDVFTF